MPVIPFTDGRIFVGGIDLSGYANKGTMELTAAELDASTISDAWDVYALGRKKVSLDVEGFWAGGFGMPDDLFSRVGSTRIPLLLLPDGDEGSTGYAMRGVPVAYSVGAPAGELMTFKVTARGDVHRAVRGTVILDDSAAITATADGTAYELGAVSASQTVYAALHVIDSSGTSPTLDVILETDTEEAFGDSPTTRFTFSQATGSTAEWQVGTGAISDTWWRVGLTVGGTNPSFTAVVLVAIH